MKLNFARHQVDIAYVDERFASAVEYAPRSLERTRNGEGRPALHVDRCVTLAACAAVVAPESAQFYEGVQLYGQAYVAMFAAATQSKERWPLGPGPSVLMTQVVDQSSVHDAAWLEAFYAAALCRDAAGLKMLAQVPLKQFAGSSTTGPQYYLLFVQALQAFLKQEATFGRLLIDAMKATDPNRPDMTAPEWALSFSTHEMRLMSLVATDSRDEFDAALREALQAHKTYWGRKEDRRRDPKGFLALPLLGIAALAYDRKLPISVQSDYLPMLLVTGKFLQQQPG